MEIVQVSELIYGNRLDNRFKDDPRSYSKYDEFMAEISFEMAERAIENRRKEADLEDLSFFHATKLATSFPDQYKEAFQTHRGYPYRTFVDLITYYDLIDTAPLIKLSEVIEIDSHLSCWEGIANFGK